MKRPDHYIKAVFLAFTLLLSACGGGDPEPTPDPSSPVACIVSPTGDLHVGDAIQFTSCSENATSFLWEFGDGTTSADEDPGHTYAAIGDYTVKLTASNGSKQSIKTATVKIIAAGNGGECITHRGFISQSQVWAKGCHIIDNWIELQNGATVTIMPGAVVKFVKSAYIRAGGSEESNFIAEGTEEEPIIFTSSQDNPQPGDWHGVIISEFATASSFKHCIFEYGGLDLFEDPSAMFRVSDGGKVKVDHSHFENSLTYAVELDNYSRFELFTNNHIHDINDFAMYVTGNGAGSIGEGNVIESKGVLISLHQVTEDTEWRGLTCPYVTESHLWIGSETGNTLTLGPGVRIEFQDTQALLPYFSTSIATIIANGTAENPVVFTSHSPEETSRWSGIKLSANFTSDSYFRHTIFEKAKGTENGSAVITVGATTLNMENCSISGEKAYGIYMEQGAQMGTFANNDFGPTNAFSIYLQFQNLLKIGDGNTFSGNKNINLGFNEILEDATFPGLPVYYYLDSDFYIGTEAGVTMTADAGSKFLLDRSLLVAYGYNAPTGMSGKLVAVGTAENPIVFERRVEPNNLNNYHLIEFNGEGVSPESTLDHCIIEGSSRGSIGIRMDYVNSTVDNPYPTIRNTTIQNFSSYAIYVSHSSPLLENNTYQNNGLNDVFYQE